MAPGVLDAVCQLVALPYNLLLSGVARKALGIDVTDQIIVIDEAHSAFRMSNVANPLTSRRFSFYVTFIIICCSRFRSDQDIRIPA